MTAQNWVDLLRVLGVAGPLVLLLAWLLREATTERREITTRFLTALQTAIEQGNESQIRAANEMTALAHTLVEQERRSTEEHARIVKAIDDLHARWNGHERRSG